MKLNSVIVVIIGVISFLCCSQKVVVIADTKNFIAFDRNPDIEPIFDYDVWLINVETKDEIRLTSSAEYWEYMPVWMSDSELLYLINPQEQTMTEMDIVYVNLKNGKRKLLDFWTWENDPGGLGKISVDSNFRVYYGSDGMDALHTISLKNKRSEPTEIFSRKKVNLLGLEEIRDPIISPDGMKLILVACDTAKYRRLREIKQFNYDIYLYDLEEKNLERLTTGDSTYRDPVWFGNDSIVFCSNSIGNYELYLMELKSRKMVRLTFTPDISETEPAVSPDHQKIAYTRSRGDWKTEIWIMDLKTKDTQYLTKGSSPAWSPAR
ncbi:MAG: TolB family protein [bacterium]